MEERKHVVEHQESTHSNGPRTFIGIIFGILELIFIVRFILKLLGADATNSLVNTLYNYTDVVVNPIKEFLGDISFTALSSNGIIELASLAVLLLLFIIGGILMSLFKPKVTHRREYQEVEETDVTDRTHVVNQRKRKQPVIERHGQERPVPVAPAQETGTDYSVPQNQGEVRNDQAGPVVVDDTPIAREAQEEALQDRMVDNRPVDPAPSDVNYDPARNQEPRHDVHDTPLTPEQEEQALRNRPIAPNDLPEDVNTDVREPQVAPYPQDVDVADNRPVAREVQGEALNTDRTPPVDPPRQDMQGRPDMPQPRSEVFEHNPDADAVREVEIETPRPNYEAGQMDPQVPPYRTTDQAQQPEIVDDRPAQVTEPTHEVEEVRNAPESFQDVSDRVPADDPQLVEDTPKREPQPEGTEEIIVDNSDHDNVVIQRKSDL